MKIVRSLIALFPLDPGRRRNRLVAGPVRHREDPDHGHRDRRRAPPSLGDRLPPRRPHAGDRADRQDADRRPGRLDRLGPRRACPKSMPAGQGGLLDVAVHPDFAENRLVYWSYAEAGEGGNSTAVARGRLSDDETALTDVEGHLLASSRNCRARPISARDWSSTARAISSSPWASARARSSAYRRRI